MKKMMLMTALALIIGVHSTAAVHEAVNADIKLSIAEDIKAFIQKITVLNSGNMY